MVISWILKLDLELFTYGLLNELLLKFFNCYKLANEYLFSYSYCTMLDQRLPCFGHLAKSLFMENILVLEELLFFYDLDKLACMPVYGWHMLVCQPSAGTGALRAPQRPLGLS